MSWDLQNGYKPRNFEELLQVFVDAINSEFSTSYDTSTIIGTNFYKFGYTAIQLIMQAENKTAEISAKLTDFIRTSNEKINLPKSTISGFIAGLLAPESEGGLGLICTIKGITNSAEAGHLFLVIDTDKTAAGYATLKTKIIEKMALWLTAGLYYEGTEVGTKTAVNGQVIEYKFSVPTLINILVKITVNSSSNATTPILNENQVRDKFNANFASLYRLGLDFEPEKYLEIARDLPFAADILIEYSENGGSTWSSQPRAMAYNEKINITAPATVIVSS